MAAKFQVAVLACALWVAACGFPRPAELPADDGGGNCGDTLTDPLNCGRCGRRCADLPGVEGSRVGCVGGRCDVGGACLPGAADCDGDEATGCEADLSRPETCGQCDAACSSVEPLCATAGGSWACRPSCEGAQVACSGSCVDLATDPRHCGRCGHGCDGGTCALGVCQPMTVYGGTELPPGRFAVADDAVFWTSDDKIASCPLPQGCRLAPHVLVENIKRLGAIAVVGPDLYFAGCTQSCDLAAHWIYHCPLSGCPIVPASSDSTGQGLFTDILAGPGHIYWWGRFGVRDRGAEYPASLFGNPLGIDYVTLGDDLYVKPTPNSGMPLFVCPRSGGCSARTELTFPDFITGPFKAFRDRLYWSAVDSSNTTRRWIYSCLPSNCANSKERVAADVADVKELAFDASGVYWLNALGEIRHCPLDGCAAAPDRIVPAGSRSGLIVGRDSVFWIENGAIWKAAKP